MKKTFTLLITSLFAIMLIIKPAKAWADDVTMSYSGNSNTNMSSSSNNATSVGLNSSNWTVSAIKGDPQYLPGLNSTDHDIRLYGNKSGNGNKITVTNSQGYTITSIEVTYQSSYITGGTVSVGNSTVTGTNSGSVYTYAINSTAFSIQNKNTSTNQVRFTSIKIYYSTGGGGTTTAAPTISGNTPFVGSTTVTITNAASADGADIFYTLNGDNPTTTISATCFAYSEPFSIDATKTVKAIAKKSTDANASSAVTQNFTKVTPITVSEALTTINALPSNGTSANQCVRGIVCTAGSLSSGAITYYISDNGTTTNRLQVYKGKGLYNANFTAATDIAVGDEVVIYGTLKNFGGTTPEFDQGSYLLSKVRNPFILPSVAELTGFTYVEGQGPSTAQTVSVSGFNLTANISLSLGENSKYEMCLTSNGTYTNSLTLTPNNSGTVSATNVYVRLKSGLSKAANYSGTITLTSTDATEKTVSLSGSVTAATHSIEQYSTPATAHGTITFSPESPVAEGTQVTLTAEPAAGYDFTANSWVFYKESGNEIVEDNSIEVTDGNKINMPTYDLYVDGTFTAKQTYAVTCVASPNAGGTISALPETAYEGQSVTLTCTPETGYTLSSVVITKTSDGSATGITVTNNAFTMPAYAVTATATFLSNNYQGSFTQYSGSLTEGDYLIVYSGDAMKNTLTSSRFDYTNLSIPEDNIITNPNRDIVWHISPSATDGYWNIYNAKKNQYVANTDGNATTMSLNSSSTIDDVLWKPTGSSTYEFQNKNNIDGKYTARYLRKNGTSGFASYQTQGGALTLYKYTPNVAPTWAGDFPTAASIIPNQEYELTVSGKASGFPTPVITLETEESGYTFEDGVFTFSSASTGIYEFTFTATNAAGDADATLTITVAAPTKVNYYYSRNGVLSAATEITQGESATLDSGSNLDGGNFTFVGWTTDPNDVETPLAAGSSQTINNETTFYAVYSRTVSITEDKVVILDGEASGLSDSYITGSAGTITENGFSYSAIGVKYTNVSSNATNAFIPANKTIIGGKDYDVCIYNSTAFGDGITKFEIYENYGTATDVTVGVNFGTTQITSYNSSASNTWSQTLSTANSVYDASEALPSGAKYFCFGISKYKNAQVQFRITYTSTHNDTKKFTRVFLDETASSAITISGPSIIPSGKYLNMDGNSLTSATAANLIIEDDAELKTTSSGVMATYTKAIQKSTNNAAKWYTISTPVKTVTPATNGIVITSVTNLVNSDDNSLYYNLYRYNEGSYQWEAYNPSEGHHTDFTALLNGQGYLYRNNGKILTFTGQVNVGNVSVPVSFASSNTNVKGFNLLGNPYSHNITLQNVTFDGDPFTDCYILNGNGGWNAAILLDNNGNIEPGQGFMVQAIKSGDATISQTIPTKSRDSKANGDFIKFTVANNEYEDVAYAVFDKGYNLTKINHRNADIQKIYIPQNGDNFAVASMADNTKSFNLNFKAMTTGRYTLSYKAKGEFSYLHVIDLLTGDDIDMLLEGEYNFIASQNDSENRFVVRLTYAPNYGEENEIFAYQNGSDILVSGYGELQVFDVLGRFVMSKNVNGSATISADALTNGVYVLRIVGTEIKTQKIVVR